MKFAHMADCHLGGWRDPRMREANAKSFVIAMDRCIEERVDFLIIAGDLFNTAIPGIDAVRLAVEQLRRLQSSGIAVYGIPGSHDYSPSGKTMLDVLESAGLFVNVAKGESVDGKLKLRFTTDPRTGVKLTGIFGRRGGLDRYYYEDLAREHLEVEGFKIFCFHCGLAELKPKGLEVMDAMSVSLLPKNFDYYAGGHVHVVDHARLVDYPNIVFPGPTFPNNFAEVEKLRSGNFVIVEDGVVRNVPLNPFKVVSFSFECDGKTPVQVESMVEEEAKRVDVRDAIVTARFSGVLAEGGVAGINFAKLASCFDGAYFVMRNTYGLQAKKYEEVKVSTDSVDMIESRVIEENCGQSGVFSAEHERALVSSLLRVLTREKDEAMKKSDFELRLIKEVRALLDI